jgi:predicted SnoaL-like aldol condensation-catalyzing enzyme
MPDAHRTLVESIVRMFATGDTSAAGAVLSAAYLDHQGLGEGDLRGPDEFRRVVTVARSGYDELDVRIEDLLIDGDRVAVRLRWSGARSERRFERETIDILRIEDGKAVEHWGARLWISEA